MLWEWNTGSLRDCENSFCERTQHARRKAFKSGQNQCMCLAWHRKVNEVNGPSEAASWLVQSSKGTQENWKYIARHVCWRLAFFKIWVFFFVCVKMFCLCVCLHLKCAWTPWRSEESIRYLGTGVADGCNSRNWELASFGRAGSACNPHTISSAPTNRLL